MLIRRLLTIDEVYDLPEPRWIVEPLLMEGTIATLFGKPGVGKSFVALDLALSIAMGKSWHGYPTTQGHVVYVTAEGAFGLKYRLRAWESYYGRIDRSRIHFFPSTINLKMQADTQEFLDQVRAVPNPLLFVFDTLSRNFEGDENSVMETGWLIRHIDYLREHTNALVLLVHHPSKADPERERGCTTIIGAIDTSILLQRVTRTQVQLTCKKQRHGEEFDPIVLTLLQRPALTRTSLVVTTQNAPPPPQQDVTTAKQKVLAHWEATGSVGSHTELKMPRSTYFKAKTELVNAGLLPKVH